MALDGYGMGGMGGGTSINNHVTITAATGSQAEIQSAVEKGLATASRQMIVSLRAGAGGQY